MRCLWVAVGEVGKLTDASCIVIGPLARLFISRSFPLRLLIAISDPLGENPGSLGQLPYTLLLSSAEPRDAQSRWLALISGLCVFFSAGAYD